MDFVVHRGNIGQRVFVRFCSARTKRPDGSVKRRGSMAPHHIGPDGAQKTDKGVTTMPTRVTPEQRRAAKQDIITAVQQGATAKGARESSSVLMHRTTVYRLLKRAQREGEGVLTDGRHGHPVKLRGDVLALVREHCQANPCVSSPAVQRLLQERCGVGVSVSQLNRVRARLGLTRKPVPREKKSPHMSRLSQDTAKVQEVCCCWRQRARPVC